MNPEPEKFDIAVIGGGPGGYPAAIEAAQLGKKVVLIDEKGLGGTCLNRGCIPTKALIAGARLFHSLNHVADFGISVSDVRVDFAKMKERKDKIVSTMCKSVEGLINSNRITIIKGFGKFISEREIKVTGATNTIIQAAKTIIATGSEPRSIGAFPFDYRYIHDSTSLLEISELPKTLAIIGGGIIGCEFASLYNILGTKVTIFEMMPTLLPGESPEVSDFLAKAFMKRGISIKTGAGVKEIKKEKEGVTVLLGNGESTFADLSLVCTGRSLNTSGIGLDTIGVIVEENGIIRVNDKMETNIPGIYAVGDIASTWWLAHVASHQGMVAAKNACGKEAHMHYDAIPSVIFTDPEIASVGLTLEKALEEGYHAKSGSFPFRALGKAQATGETEGFAQIVIDTATGQILGAQIVGSEAGILIAEAGIAVANELTLDCVIETIHAHPTMAEIWHEAALMVNDTPLHLPPKKKRTTG